MMRRSFQKIPSSISVATPCASSLFVSFRHCSVHDLDGAPHSAKREYQPRVRPRRLVMPIDTDSLHDSRRSGELEHYLEETQQLREEAEEHSAVKLGVVPEDKSYADLFSAVFVRMKEKRKSGNLNSGAPATAAATVLSSENHRGFELVNLSNDADVPLSTERKSDELASSSSSSSLSYRLWDSLQQTPLNAPFGGGLGSLSASGESFIQLEVTSFLFKMYPRLRSCHVQTLLHSVTGLQPMLRLGKEIGLMHLTGIETDVGLWSELCNLQQREDITFKNLAHQRQRQRLGMPNNQVWLYEKELHALKYALRKFPTDAATLLPRVSWARNLVFAFVGWLELSEGEAAARDFVREKILVLFEPEEADGEGGGASLVDDNPDEHPLNKQKMRRAHRLNSVTSHIQGAEPFDDPFERHSTTQLRHLANRRVQEAVAPQNALKEAQIILNYSPFVPRDELQMNEVDESAVKFDIEVRTVPQAVDLDSDSAGSDVMGPEERQGALKTKMLEADLVVWRRRSSEENTDRGGESFKKVLIGRGQGLSEQDAVQAVCLDFVRRYFFSPLAH